MRVEFIYDLSCPNVCATRTNLMRAFSRAGVQASWQEWDKALPEAPAYVKKYGSPTLLINGEDLLGLKEDPKSNGDCCRMYPSGGVPSVDLIAEALIRAAKQGRGASLVGTIAAGPGIGAAFLAKAACLFCYPALASFLSSVGLGFLFQDAPLIMLTVAALLVVLFGLWYKARSRWGYRPLYLGLISIALGAFSKFAESDSLFYVSVLLLVSACIWNLIPNRSCVDYATTEAK